MIPDALKAGVALCVMLIISGCGSEDASTAVAALPVTAPRGPDAAQETAPLPPRASLPAEPASIMVEVQGAVAHPGVYEFPAEARLFDALERAGGAAQDAEIRDLNIAATLIDGSVLSVPRRQQGGAPQATAAQLNPPRYTRSGWHEQDTPADAPPEGAGGAMALIDLNTASQSELETLPGVGTKTAEKIIRYREQQPFTRVDDLGFVQGIGEKRLETLRPLVTVADGT